MGYCEVSDIKGRVETDLTDADITILIENSALKIDAYCNRDFKSHTETIKERATFVVYGKGSLIILPSFPVISVESIKVDGDVLSGWTVLKSGVVTDVDITGESIVEVTYTWGFESPPEAVKEANVELVVITIEYPDTLKKADIGVTSEKIGDYSYNLQGKELPTGIKLLLLPWLKRDIKMGRI